MVNKALEIVGRIGNLVRHLLPLDTYVATDINSRYLVYLCNMALCRTYLQIKQLDLSDEGTFDTVIV